MWRWAVAASLALIQPTIAFGQVGPEDNSEMATLFKADQETRRNATPGDYQDQEFVRRMIEEDEARRMQTQELLAAGALSTANDYYRAAFIFQHGGKPDSYLLAHTLAVAATARGHERAPWIAAATLDRYLQSIGREQIYGTQYSRPSGEPWTMEPYDRSVIPDALREALGVPAQPAQTDRLEEMRKRDGNIARSSAN